MRTIVWIGILVVGLLLAPKAEGSPFVDHYTSCEGSWDGEGQTTCEILGVPGTVYGSGMSFSPYSPTFEVLVEITALSEGNSLTVSAGLLSYWTGTRWLTTEDQPKQFAYWEREDESLIVGIEDLTSPSDWDYNDYVVRLSPKENVPEPFTIGLMLIGLGMVGRRYAKR
jgi:preprotein translocase subunit Sec61beta